MELLMQPGSSLKKPLKSLLLKVPMLWAAAITSREILWEDPLAFSPALCSATSPSSSHPERQGTSWGFSGCLLTSLRQTASERNVVKQSLAPQRLRVYALITPARCYFQLLALQVLLSLLTKHCFLLRAHRSAPTCAVLLLCTAGESFEAYSKPCHSGQMDYVFS